jgi:hypothetical protein
MITRIEGKCQWPGCDRPAEFIVSGRSQYAEEPHPETGCFCAIHAAVVEDEGNPEYTNVCPNCGCRHGVN